MRTFSGDDVTAEIAVDALDPMLGIVLDGRFRIVDVLGTGGMGKVYRAVQTPLNRAVALKVLDYNYGAGRDEAFRQRFLVEAALTAKLSHPNTVRVYDYGCTQDGIFFLAMEFLDGDTLDKVFQKGPLPWRRALGIGQHVARALKEAHELGVVHRDLKPGNIMLLHVDDDADHVKVLDFGLVKSFVDGHELEGRAITQQGMLMGSPPYMAPEQGERNRADPRSDVYSLGTVLYEMMTGAPPFTGGSVLEVVMKHVNAPVPPMVTPPGLEPISPSMEALVLRCLAKSPMDRFQSMEEVLVAMQELAQPIATPYETPAQSYPDGVAAPPRSPVRLVVGFLIALSLGIGGTVAVMRRSPAAPAEVGAATTAAATTVRFHIESEPAGATVLRGGAVLGVTPLDVDLPAGEGGRTRADFTLKKDGYLPLTVTSGGSGPRIELFQSLQAKAAETAPEPSQGKTPAPKPPVVEPPAVIAAPAPAVVKPAPPAAEPTPKPTKALAPRPKPDALPVVKTLPVPTKRLVKKAKPTEPPTGSAAKLGDDEDEVPVTPPDDLKRPRP